jgi:dTDP-4-dehydrorhamnose reductase
VHISTDYVFGGETERTRPYTEEDSPRPINVDGASKALGESLALAANPDSLILRVASLFGISGSSGKGGNFVETMIKVGRDKGALRVVNDQQMSPTATADVAEALLHVVNSGSATWYEFTQEIVRLAGISASVQPIRSAELSLAAKRPHYSVLDNNKVAHAVGRPRSWQEALAAYLVEKRHAA